MQQIGKRPAGQDQVDTARALLDCHDRIRQMIAIARTVAAAPAGSDPAEVREAAARVRRYFTEALPRHVEDEELSILPRLGGREPELDRALAAMRAEHAAHEEAVARLIAACRALEASPDALAALKPELDLATRAVAAEMDQHLADEERIVIPALGRLLGADEEQAIRAEMRARRSRG